MNDLFVYPDGGVVEVEGAYERDQFTNALQLTYNYQNQCRPVEYYAPYYYPETPMESWYLDDTFASEDPMNFIEPGLTNDIDTPISFSMRVSTSFLPDSHPAHMPDIVLITSDSVLFHVCTSLIISQSRHHLEDLAINSSSFLLSISPGNITDEQAESMGAVALKRLLLLHSNRVESLRDLLLQVPKYHPVTEECSFTDQRAVSRSWKMASAAILWVAGPDIPSSEIRNNLGSLARVVHCKQCSKMIRDRIKDALKAWLDLKRTV
ncbi:hypothetical protein BJ165DRAFT_1399883 [Panaeolus papilionaceus]|nr:hypothetical protein BJ165DRAFT_1399883 [Panaeolus papilionaceus]